MLTPGMYGCNAILVKNSPTFLVVVELVAVTVVSVLLNVCSVTVSNVSVLCVSVSVEPVNLVSVSDLINSSLVN